MSKATSSRKVDRRLQKALDDFPKIIEEQRRNFEDREKDIRRFSKLSRSLVLREKQRAKAAQPTLLENSPPVHPWRSCPYGEHWTKEHPVQLKPSRKNPAGKTTKRSGACEKSPSGKDHLYPYEIALIARTHFAEVKLLPCGLTLGFRNGSKYDQLIGGWVQYWNEILRPDNQLDPNFVKALIASESGFREKILASPKDSNSARGLTQVTNQTRRALGDMKGELKDHFVNVTKEDLNDPCLNICSGVRWLFHKRELTSKKIGHSATWLEAVADYKGASTTSDKRAAALIKKFTDRYAQLSECKKV